MKEYYKLGNLFNLQFYIAIQQLFIAALRCPSYYLPGCKVIAASSFLKTASDFLREIFR